MTIYGIIPGDLYKGLCDSAALGIDVTDERLREYIARFDEYPEISANVFNFCQMDLAMKLCADSPSQRPCVVIAYPPFCSVPTEFKVAKAKYAVEKYKVSYILLTFEHSKFADGKYDEVKEDLQAVVKAVDKRATVIVLADFAHWTEDQCVQIAKIMRDAGVDILKSTGGLGRVESPRKIARVVKELNGEIKIMGTSAIKNLEEYLDMVDADPDKIAISRAAFFDVYEEVHALEKVRLTKEELAGCLIGIVWHPTIKEKEVMNYLQKAKAAGLYGVSVDPRWVPLAAKILGGSKTKVISRLDYPFGDSVTELKQRELEWVISNGTKDMEIQTTMNISAFKSGHYEYVKEELKALVKTAMGHPISVIIQMPLLSKEEILKACEVIADSGISFVEPRHGFLKFSPDGAIITADKIDYMEIKKLKEFLGDKVKIRATGAVNRVAAALVPLANGAVHVTTPDVMAVIDNYDVLVERIKKYNK